MPSSYTTKTEMQRLFSAYGVLAFSDHDEDDTEDAGVVDDCIEQATLEMQLYLLQRYNDADIVNSPLVRRWATTVAIYLLCLRRGNDAPPGIAAEFERIVDKLEQVMNGSLQFPGIAQLADLRPSVSNLVVDRRYTSRNIRVKLPASTVSASALTRLASARHGYSQE